MDDNGGNNPVKILIIDDEIFIRESMGIFFEDEDFDVRTAEDGLDGIGKFTSFQPDVIFLDMRMPGMNGFEVIKKMKELSSLVPVIVMSGNSGSGYADEALARGAWDYITKPVCNLPLLLEKVDDVLEKTRLMKRGQSD